MSFRSTSETLISKGPGTPEKLFALQLIKSTYTIIKSLDWEEVNVQ